MNTFDSGLIHSLIREIYVGKYMCVSFILGINYVKINPTMDTYVSYFISF